jgi:molybdenum transport protein
MIYFTDAEIDQLISEDFPYYDLTSLSIKLGSKVARISFATRQNTVICGTEEVLKIFEKFKITPTLFSFSGEQIEAGIKFLEGEGLAKNVHAIWRTTANLLEFASGVATRTRSLVEAANAVVEGIPIVTSRKTIPFTKKIAMKAVRIGGAHIHRLNLSDSILIFDNHIKFLGGLELLVKKIPEIRKQAPGKRLTVEVKTTEEALLMAKSTIDCLQIDKMGASDLSKLVVELKKINPKLFISASGNINEENIGSYAETGIDMIITSYPYYGKPADLQVNIEPVFDL